jgi:hypothetical protein
MTTKLSLDRNNITSIITLSDSWVYPGDVAVEETMNNRFLYAHRISEESAFNLAYELMGSGWRVIEHSL